MKRGKGKDWERRGGGRDCFWRGSGGGGWGGRIKKYDGRPGVGVARICWFNHGSAIWKR